MSKKKAMFFRNKGGSIIPIENIIEYWNMDGNSNGYNGFDGTDTSISYPTGFINESADFTAGASSAINTIDDDVFSFGNGTTDVPFSISFWVNWNSKTAPSDKPFFISKRSGAAPEWSIAVDSVGRISCYLFSNTSNTIQKRGYKFFTPSLNTWYHIVMTYAGGSGVANYPLIYINNDATSPVTLQVGAYVAMNNTVNGLLFGRAGFSNNFSLDGYMDEIAIYDIELSASQVEDLYNAGIAGTPII